MFHFSQQHHRITKRIRLVVGAPFRAYSGCIQAFHFQIHSRENACVAKDGALKRAHYKPDMRNRKSAVRPDPDKPESGMRTVVISSLQDSCFCDLLSCGFAWPLSGLRFATGYNISRFQLLLRSFCFVIGYSSFVIVFQARRADSPVAPGGRREPGGT